ncbi:hypothetical protein BABA_06226 [Neobacillus bataviensis LMG 21833]|uniref:Uncharacterized protein n=1 Tax=Neobacillus bataviensis LMG 21833 TaxID=1117379 RepID=K6CGI3_9BACI|nr:hypothetical protein [Neobacillus bataviensis]EKN70260.1 hypothetical protein BABA_06226 [Neobacillus bataviensis LMG 21833]
MGHFGFSYVGCIYLLMLFIPNIIWTKNRPEGYESFVIKENKTLLLFERVGQVCVTCVALIFSDFNIGSINLWSFWLVISFVLMLFYEINWIRYFKGKHTLKSFYGSFCGFPVASASLPIMAFLLLSIYGKVIWLFVSVIVLGVGHIGIHLQHLKAIK